MQFCSTHRTLQFRNLFVDCGTNRLTNMRPSRGINDKRQSSKIGLRIHCQPLHAICIVALCLCSFSWSGCQMKTKKMLDTIDIQGHRGCRGLMPENTIAGFKRALDIGVHTLELDVVANRYGDVIVSHEPFFNHLIALDSIGNEIDEANERQHNMYGMSVDELQSYDVGRKKHPLFLQQKKVAATKPLLSEMVRASEVYAAEIGAPLPRYNIEIKRLPEHDGLFHPEMSVFADLVCDMIDSLGIQDRTTVQCFDVETLQYLHRNRSEFSLVYLIANQDGFANNIEKLGFMPAVYSPYYKLVDAQLRAECQKGNVLLIPWTVNEAEDIELMLELDVDGIISDYPDRVIEIVEARQSIKK